MYESKLHPLVSDGVKEMELLYFAFSSLFSCIILGIIQWLISRYLRFICCQSDLQRICYPHLIVFSHYESILGNTLTDIDLFRVPVFLAQVLIKPPRGQEFHPLGEIRLMWFSGILRTLSFYFQPSNSFVAQQCLTLAVFGSCSVVPLIRNHSQRSGHPNFTVRLALIKIYMNC